MIYIEKDSTNTFALTLTENTSWVAPYWLFKFQWEFDMTSDPIYWEGVDVSSYPSRYNLFDLEEGVDATFKIGQYTYTVYASVDPLTIDENTSEVGLEEVEEGRMVVNGTSTTIYD